MSLDPAHLDSLIGVPFAYGGRGPDTYDCWGLVQHLYELWHGVRLPEQRYMHAQAQIALTMAHQLRAGLYQKVEPQPGSVVLLKLKGGVAAHVGFQYDLFRIAHAWKHSGGVTTERLDDWKAQNRVVGHYMYLPSA